MDSSLTTRGGEGAMSSSSLSDVDSSGSDSETPEVEWLATGRQRRSTAGNRMNFLLTNEEEPDSDLELLFAEQGDDQGFSDDDAAASDVHMDSSSDDEDDDNNTAGVLEGEAALEEAEKQKRNAQRKRKAHDAIPAKFRKKVRIGPTTTTSAPVPRLKKKSERASWLPSPADLPTRASSRSTTRMSKEQLHLQMEEREAKRLKQLAQMQKKAAKLEAMKKPPMTQEERLGEAALVEERNSKSLNRWEEAEKQREEERRMKLAALNERTLKGPVITFWSGVGRVGDGWLKNEGYHFMIEEKPKKKKEKLLKDKARNAEHVQMKDAGDNVSQSDLERTLNAQTRQESTRRPGDLSRESMLDVIVAAPAAHEEVEIIDDEGRAAHHVSVKLETQSGELIDRGKLEGAEVLNSSAHATSKLHVPPGLAGKKMIDAPQDGEEHHGNTTHSNEQNASANVKIQEESQPKTPLQQHSPTIPKDEASQSIAAPVLASDLSNGERRILNSPKSNIIIPPETHPDGQIHVPKPPCSPSNKDIVSSPQQNALAVAHDISTSQNLSEAATPQQPLDQLQANESTTRNAIIFQNFDDNSLKDKGVQTQLLFRRKMNRLPKPSAAPVCPITNNTARYRDSKTGIPFYSAAAYHELNRLQNGDYNWSKLLGAWVGSGRYAARGVPERFLNPARCPTKEEVERIECKKRAQEKQQLLQEQQKREKSVGGAMCVEGSAAKSTAQDDHGRLVATVETQSGSENQHEKSVERAAPISIDNMPTSTTSSNSTTAKTPSEARGCAVIKETDSRLDHQDRSNEGAAA